MKTKTDEEKEFNKLVNDYGRKAYTKYEFDNDVDLQKALKSFISSENFVLKDDFSNLDEFQTYHHDFLENKDDYFNDIDRLRDSETIEYTKKLFKMTDHSIAKKIASEEYYEVWTNGFTTYIDKNGEKIQNTEIQEKIDKFHNFCINVDNTKKFIKSYFPRWEHFTREEKTKAKKEIKVLITNLEILKIDKKPLEVTYYFITKYQRLNQDIKYKADILLCLQLPKINNLSIAKEIVKYLKLS